MYETNGLYRGDKYEEVEAIGVGIATTSYGFYIDFRYMSEDQLKVVKELYREYLDKHHSNIWVFNIDFEMLITRMFLGEWAIYDFRDADIFRIIYGHQVGYSKKIVEDRRARGTAPKFKEIRVNRDQRWSLKYTAQKYLNVESWDNEFEWVENKFYTIFNGFQHDNINDFLQNPMVGNLIHSWVEEGIMTEAEVTKLLRSLCAFKKIPTSSVLKTLFKPEHEDYAKAFVPVILGCKTIKQVKSHPFYNDILERYPEHTEEFNTLLGIKKYFGNGFAIQPSQVVGKYCIIDSYYTLMIAEKYYELDEFNYDPNDPDKIPAKWMTTDKMVEIFASNKAIGAKLHMFGLNKSNTRRDRYDDIQNKARVHSNYVVALAYYQMLLSEEKIENHASNDLLHPVFKSVISKGGNPMDFGRVTKVLFPHIYDPSCEFGWNEARAEELLGDISEEVKSILLTHKPKGFENPSAHSRALNLHKEAAALIEETWSFQDLPDNFNWLDIKKYYTDLAKLDAAKMKLVDLNTCNIKGLHIDEILKMDTFSIKGEDYTFKEALLVLKKQYYDLNANNEMVIGAMSERWKDYKTLLFLYHPQEYKSQIDDLELWKVEDSIEFKVNSFKGYMDNVINVYEKINFFTQEGVGNMKPWEAARRYARLHDYPDNLKNPDEDDMNDNLQVNAYLDRMLSFDLMQKHGVSVELMNQYVWYQTISREDIMTRKGWLLDEKHASPICYKNWMSSVGLLGKLHDNLAIGDIGSNITTDTFAIADFDVDSPEAYTKLAMAFKFNRRYDKLSQYISGQLCKDDDRLLYSDSDGVGHLEGLTLSEKLNSTAGDNVRMFPRYDIMQKSTKRNSSGVHTVPSRNQVKGIIEAKEDELLVYTDISGMELRGISAVSQDAVMQKVFDDGLDLYTVAADAYYNGYKKLNLPYAEVRKRYRGASIGAH